LGSVVLGGLSMGGYAAFACLRRAPERVRGLILADTRATADTEAGRAAREATARYVEEHGAAALVKRDVDKLFGHVTQREHPEIINRARIMASENSPAGVAAASRGMALRDDATTLLPYIACPTLIIVGEQDALTPVADARLLFERIPDAQLEVLADAGHLSNLERPEAFTDLVAQFLRERVPLPE
jgi:pimeloyl-ACP methyl ester carboxylesterase